MLTKSDAAMSFISFFGILGSTYLTYQELSVGNVCPRFFGVPACYLVLAAYVLILISVVSLRKFFYGTGVFLGLLLGVWFSLNHYTGVIVCPEIRNIPLCYVSLLAFAIIFILGMIRRS